MEGTAATRGGAEQATLTKEQPAEERPGDEQPQAGRPRGEGPGAQAQAIGSAEPDPNLIHGIEWLSWPCHSPCYTELQLLVCSF